MGDRLDKLGNWMAGDPGRSVVPALFTLGDPTKVGHPATVGAIMNYAESKGMIDDDPDGAAASGLHNALVSVARPTNLAGLAVKHGMELPLFGQPDTKSDTDVHPTELGLSPGQIQAIDFLESL